jgi:hypothetical protein
VPAKEFDMTVLTNVCRMLVGLFVDDGALALAIIVIVLLSWIFASLLPALPLAAGAVLLVGSLVVLLANVMKAAGRSPAKSESNSQGST